MRWQLDFCCTICLWHSIFKYWFLLSDISQFPPCKVIKSCILVRISILNLLPLFLKDLNSKPSDKPNPRSWKPYWRPSVTEVPPPKKSKSDTSLSLPSFYPLPSVKIMFIKVCDWYIKKAFSKTTFCANLNNAP